MSAPAKYLAIAGAGARRALGERTALVGYCLFLGSILFIFARVWKVIGVASPLPGVGPRELVWYLALAEWAVLSAPMVYLAVEADVRSGDIACRLVRPVPYVGAQVAEALGEAAVRLAALGPCSFLFAWLFSGGLPADPRGLWLAPPLALLGSLLWVLSLVLIGLSAFWIVDTSPVYWIWQKLGFVLGGLLFPLELYPDWLQRVAHFTPFPNLCWAAGRSAFGFAPGEALALFAQGLLWTALLGLALFWVSSRARARLVVNGG